MENILNYFDGKKTTILAITAAIISYLVATGLITAELGALLQTIISLLAGGAVVATNRVLGYRNKFGERTK